MVKTDYKKQFRELYTAHTTVPKVLTVPPLQYLAIDGAGDPNSSKAYADAIQTLYPIAYTIKFICKLEHDHDFSVLPFESLWWSDDMSDFTSGNKSKWHWRAMIMQPPVVTQDIYEAAVAQARQKRRLPSEKLLTFMTYEEGTAAQILHIGSYASEGPTIKLLHQFIGEQGGSLDGARYHHEIYMSDPRRTAPEKLQTIIRQPFVGGQPAASNAA